MNRFDCFLTLVLVAALGATGCDRRRPGALVRAAPSGSGPARPLESGCDRMTGDALARCEQNVQAIRNVTEGPLLNAQ